MCEFRRSRAKQIVGVSQVSRNTTCRSNRECGHRRRPVIDSCGAIRALAGRTCRLRSGVSSFRRVASWFRPDRSCPNLMLSN